MRCSILQLVFAMRACRNSDEARRLTEMSALGQEQTLYRRYFMSAPRVPEVLGKEVRRSHLIHIKEMT